MPKRFKQLAKTWRFVLGIFALLGIVSGVFAQTSPTVLNMNEAVTGILTDTNIADVYTFTGTANTTVTLTATSTSLNLSLLLTNPLGISLGEVTAIEGAASLENVLLTQSGTYVLTVFAAIPNGSYELTMSSGGASANPTLPVLAQATPTATTTNLVTTVSTPAPITQFTPPQDILVSNGMEVRLQWDSQVDLNLEVRDPRGNTLYFDNRTSAIGGSFGFDANGLCEVISEAPVERATWQPGFLPTGSYEILIFYRQSCVEGTAQPVNFSLTVLVNGVQLQPIQATITPPPTTNQDSVYLASFSLNTDATGAIRQGGLYPDSSINQLPAPSAQITANPLAISRNIASTGIISNLQVYQTYAFDAQADEVLTISLTATAGNLDTLLQLVGPNGNLLTVNDDANDTRNSAISNYRVIQAGRYTVVATRYGKELGGTEGEYALLIAETSAELPAAIANLTLPDGEVEVYLTWSTVADLQLLVRDPVGQSVYDDTPQISSGGILAANGNVNCQQAAGGNPVSYIYWPLGFLRPGIYETEVWYQNTCNGTIPTEFTLTVVVGGQVIVSERRVPAIGQRFVLSFEVGNDGTAEAGPGGFVDEGVSTLNLVNEQALPILFNQASTGSITIDNDFDVYTFTGRFGQIVTISLTATSQTLDTNVFLLDANNVVIASNDDADPNLVVGNQTRVTDSLISNFTLPADGEYKIVTTRFATQYGGTIGTYRISLQASN